MQTHLKQLLTIAAFGLAAIGLANSSRAADKKSDPTGTWTWSFTTQNGDTITPKLTLKLEGEKLTGKVSGRGGNESPIEEAKLKGDEISFQVTRERDGEKFVTKYNGKISGDTIKGKFETNFGGQNRSREWEAKKEVAK